jgi:hypothetical protein
MNSTITLTDEQMEALQEGKSITIEPPKKEPKKFRCHEANRWFCDLEGKPEGAMFTARGERENYAYQATKQEALEFEKLRKQLAIQFEFLKLHAPDWKPDWKDAEQEKCRVYYNHNRKIWLRESGLTFEILTIHMPKEVAGKFCGMANAGLIEGLEV